VTVLLAVGIAWPLVGTVVAMAVGGVIRRADRERLAGTVLDRLLVEDHPHLEVVPAPRAAAQQVTPQTA
jgi:hypothetical protein